MIILILLLFLFNISVFLSARHIGYKRYQKEFDLLKKKKELVESFVEENKDGKNN